MVGVSSLVSVVLIPPASLALRPHVECFLFLYIIGLGNFLPASLNLELLVLLLEVLNDINSSFLDDIPQLLVLKAFHSFALFHPAQHPSGEPLVLRNLQLLPPLVELSHSQ